jgi:hypothetical protein
MMAVFAPRRMTIALCDIAPKSHNGFKRAAFDAALL